MTALRAAPTLRDATKSLIEWLEPGAVGPPYLAERLANAKAALAHPPKGAQPEPYRITIAINALRGIGMESEANAVAELATVLQAEGAQTEPVTKPLEIFSHGPWLFEETGERFTGAELDAEAFDKYRAEGAQPEPAAWVSRNALELVKSKPLLAVSAYLSDRKTAPFDIPLYAGAQTLPAAAVPCGNCRFHAGCRAHGSCRIQYERAALKAALPAPPNAQETKK